MPTRIRMSRRGAKHRPFYWVIVQDSDKKRDGEFIAHLGTFDPSAKDGIKIDVAEAKKWIQKGAQPSRTVAHLIDRAPVVAS